MLDWQTMVSLAVVAGAAIVVLRGMLGVGAQSKTCGSGGCERCPSNASSSQAPRKIALVQLGDHESE